MFSVIITIMKRYILAFITLSALSLLLIMHLYGMAGHLYLNYWFYDLITHFLAGAGIALSVFYIIKNPPRHIILITFIAGIAWELFEIYFDITGWPISSMEYRIDTLIDLAMDTLGALIVWWVIRYKK